MINERQAKKYCCEGASKIENYDKAIADNTQTWEIHHRGEILPCGVYSRDDLKKFDFYYNRPANELIFLTRSEHSRLHSKTRRGEKHPMFGKHFSAEAREKMSEAKRGEKHPMFGKHFSAEAREKRSKPVQQLDKSTGELLETFPSILEAQRVTGIACSNICHCCQGSHKSAGGFVWQYATK